MNEQRPNEQCPALFVGGPWDGVRRLLDRTYPTWEVAVTGPQFLAPFDMSMPPPQEAIHATRVIYDRMYSTGRLDLYLVRDEHPLYDHKSMKRLLYLMAEGYRNIPRYEPHD